jgi:hypothetical protein
MRRTTGTACDEITSVRPKLVDVANKQEGGLVRHGLHERLHQHDIDHGGLVDDQQVTIERVRRLGRAAGD